MFKVNALPIFNVKTTTGATAGIIGKSTFRFQFKKLWNPKGKRYWPTLPQADDDPASDFDNTIHKENTVYLNETSFSHSYNKFVNVKICGIDLELEIPNNNNRLHPML